MYFCKTAFDFSVVSKVDKNCFDLQIKSVNESVNCIGKSRSIIYLWKICYRKCFGKSAYFPFQRILKY